MALLAPMPMAMVSRVTMVNMGECIRRRVTCRISARRFQLILRNTRQAGESSQFLGRAAARRKRRQECVRRGLIYTRGLLESGGSWPALSRSRLRWGGLAEAGGTK